MHYALRIPSLLICASAAALTLSGCVLWLPGNVPSGPQAIVTTVPPTCTLPKSTPLAQGASVDVLRAAFTRVRTATPVAIDEAAKAAPVVSGVKLTSQKIGAPVLHVDAASLVTHDIQRVGSIQATLAALQAALKAHGDSVEHELAVRIPWIASETLPQDSQSNKQQSDAAQAGLDLISFVTEKKATLLKNDPSGQQTPFGAGDQQKLLPSLQQLAGLEPFRLVTLLTAQQIIDQLSSQNAVVSETPQLIALATIFNASNFLATYFDAYFRGSQFVQVTVNEQSLENDVITTFNTRLKTQLPASATTQLRDAVASVCKKIAGGCASSPALGSDSFVSLFGQTVQFGGVTVELSGATSGNPLRPSVNAPAVGVFGPQMTQVLIEALFDANGPHPQALTTSTACASGLYSKTECVDSGKTDDTWSKVNMVGNATQALVTTGVGVVIRGGNVAALNNEAIAAVVETLAGVSTRKAIQQVMAFCNGTSPSASIAPAVASQ